ncbi:MAG: hypothetical protein AAB683_00270 [Patescibacteria group bacterium]
MYKILQLFIDFIFPPNKEEIELRSISKIDLYNKYKNTNTTEFPFIYSIFTYKDPVIKELIWQIKYRRSRSAVSCAGYAIYRELIKLNLNNTEKILLIPIPNSKSRKRERGYNQCELIVDEVLKNDNENRFIKDFKLLIRVKDIEKQTHKNREDRLNNSENIFKLNGKIKENSVIVIIDDVTTTGSTLLEARKTFLKAGFTDIKAIALAH